MLMAAYNLLRIKPTPTRSEIRQGIAGNLCRCTGYQKIIDAIEAVVKRTPSQEPIAASVSSVVKLDEQRKEKPAGYLLLGGG
jgi:xanthine dehydrogenase iron-sulfur cluster and FAD-binding subunit A